MFPATVRVGDEKRWTKARAIVVGDRFVVLSEADRVVERVLDAQVTEYRRGLYGQPHTIVTSEGEFTVNSEGGCGCGSRLKRYSLQQVMA